jgi:RNA polymerase sigma-70 factor, ECF subfamily
VSAAETVLVEDPTVIAAVRAGGQRAFDDLVTRHRREIHVHCYRMVGSFDEAEEHTQETFLRAWRARSGFEGRATVRGWLYRIATNVCLDAIKRRPERKLRRRPDADWVHAGPPPRDLPWLQPYPDAALDIPAAPEEQPEAIVVTNEALGLAFLTTVQLLAPKQRAVLILREVLDWSAQEVAVLLDTSVAAVNSALQRARAILAANPRATSARPAELTAEDHALIAAYLDAHHRADPDAIVAFARADLRITMPPDDVCLIGETAARQFFTETFDRTTVGEFRLVSTRANGQPAAANYLRRPDDTVFRAFSIDVLQVDDGKLVEITSFFVPGQFHLYGLPDTL